MFKIYLSLIWFFIKTLFSIREYKDFLERRQRIGTGVNRNLYKVLDRRFLNEKRGRTQMTREDLIMFLFGQSLLEKDPKKFQIELDTTINLLLLWRCESIKKEEITDL